MQSEKSKSSHTIKVGKKVYPLRQFLLKLSLIAIILMIELFLFWELIKALVGFGVDFLFTDSWIRESIPNEVISHAEANELRDFIKHITLLYFLIFFMVTGIALIGLLIVNMLLLLILAITLLSVMGFGYIVMRYKGKTHQEAMKVIRKEKKTDEIDLHTSRED